MASSPPQEEQAPSPPTVFTSPYLTISMDSARQIQQSFHQELEQTVQNQVGQVLEQQERDMSHLREEISDMREDMGIMQTAIINGVEEKTGDQLRILWRDHLKKHITAAHNEALQGHRESASAARMVARMEERDATRQLLQQRDSHRLLQALIVLVVMAIALLMALLFGVRFGVRVDPTTIHSTERGRRPGEQVQDVMIKLRYSVGERAHITW